MADGSKQAANDVNRRACTSAAMIGLAISMGASSLLVAQQNDRAIAAEPLATEPTVTSAPAQPEVASLPSTPEIESTPVVPSGSEASAIHHAVQEGQTLWSIAQYYQIDAASLASINNLSPDSVLHVGQILRVPTSGHRVVAYPPIAATKALETVDPTPAAHEASRGSAPNEVPVQTKLDSNEALSKARQDFAVDKMSMKREELSSALSKLKSSHSLDGEKPPVAEAEATVFPPQENTTTQTSSEVSTAQERLAPQSQLLAKQDSQTSKAVSVFQSEFGPSQNQFSSSTLPAPVKVATVREFNDTLKPSSSPLGTAAKTYKVQPGDTLDRIARLHGVSRKDLVRVNEIRDPNFIRVNQQISIPNSTAVKVASRDLTSVMLTPESEVSEPIGQVYPTGASVVVPTVVAIADSPTSQDALLAPKQPVPVASVPVSGFQPIYSGIAGMSQQEFKGSVPSTSEPASIIGVSAPNSNLAAVSAPSNLTTPFSDSTVNPVIQLNPDRNDGLYLQNLKDEISRLREKYRNQAPQVQVKDEASPSSQSSAERLTVASRPATAADLQAVNPEFSPRAFSQSLRSEVVALKGTSSEAPPSSQASSPATVPAPQQMIATAPLGSENYDSIVQPLVGQMVSPDLPPLSAADRYLPNGAASFNGFIWPAKGVLTSGYGWRWGRMHRGIDIAAPVGTPILSAAPGVVVYAGWNSGGYGNLVEVQHPDGSLTRYAHNSRILVQVGQQVDQGQQIAEMGSTGYSTGPHCHFEVHPAGQGAVNPMAYLPR
ncbi:hypothetical protein BST81_17180 [Leptolyngbya sp. 'hensonii']|nr:hypothetical protein BST81_17180 [Leptolyngbya sp. 'hensonii']